MNRYLLFRLYGPMAAWGDIAVGEVRPSAAHPSKSAILGLLAAAMGIKRDQEEAHQAMAATYGFAVQLDAPGILLRDYHTTQVPPEQRKVAYYTRRDELRAPKLNTILSGREYRCDALYTIALWQWPGKKAFFGLDELAEGLRNPRFTLYLGRKSCPLGLPIQTVIREAVDLPAAFELADFNDGDILDGLKRPDRATLYWEVGVETGDLKALYTFTRRDLPLSRRRWQFAERSEQQGTPPTVTVKED